jgi:PAS domain S-box-containing protein
LGHIRRALPTVLVLFAGVAASVGAFLSVRDAQGERARARFDLAVVESRQRLDATLRVCEDLLRGVRGLVHARGDVDRDEFRLFVQAMGLEGRYPGLQAVAYGVPVPPGGGDAVLARLRAEHGDPAMAIHPGLGYEADAVILFEEPEEPNREALGFNSASRPDQRAPLLAARDTGEVRASRPMALAQAPDAGPGLVLRLGVYGGDGVPATAAARREAFKGYVNAVFLMSDLAREAVARLALDGIRVEFSDVTEPEASVPFLSAGSQHPRQWWHLLARGGYARRVEVPVHGRTWALSFHAGPTFHRLWEAASPWATGAVALVLVGLMGALVISIRRTGDRAQELARRMTAELRQSESRLRAITRVMPDLILVLDEDGRYVEVHSTDPGLMVGGAEDVVGQTVASRMPPGLAERMLATIRAALATGRVQSMEYGLPTATGERYVEARVAPMDIAVDGRACVIWVARDVTERRAHEEARREAQKLESLGLLAGGIAHDFNNLLTAIGGHAALARMAIAQGRDPLSHLDMVDSSIQRASDLSRQLLAYSGRAHVEREPVDLNALIGEMSGLLGVSHGRNVRMELDLDPGTPPVDGDRVQLQQVVMNLITNASEAVPSAGGRVALATRPCRLQAEDLERLLPGQEMDPGPHALVTVSDNGTGIASDVLPRIFDPFFTTKASGRGLGLSAIRGIVRSHRGGIAIQSAPGQGTTFRVYLPAGRPASQGRSQT